MSHIAEMNIAYLLYPWGDPRVAEFVDNIDRVHAAAERTQGYVWRLKGEDENLPENDLTRLFGRPGYAVATLTVWESFEDLDRFVHKTIHGRFLDRRVEWFDRLDAAPYVIWPVAEGHIPSLEEGKEKLMQLRANGPTEAAYDFRYKA